MKDGCWVDLGGSFGRVPGQVNAEGTAVIIAELDGEGHPIFQDDPDRPGEKIDRVRPHPVLQAEMERQSQEAKDRRDGVVPPGPPDTPPGGGGEE